MRLRKGLQVLNWIWADLFYLVVLNDSFLSRDLQGCVSFCKALCIKWF